MPSARIKPKFKRPTIRPFTFLEFWLDVDALPVDRDVAEAIFAASFPTWSQDERETAGGIGWVEKYRGFSSSAKIVANPS